MVHNMTIRTYNYHFNVPDFSCFILAILHNRAYCTQLRTAVMGQPKVAWGFINSAFGLFILYVHYVFLMKLLSVFLEKHPTWQFLAGHHTNNLQIAPKNNSCDPYQRFFCCYIMQLSTDIVSGKKQKWLYTFITRKYQLIIR